MLIPQKLYNPELSDQSVKGYIRAYDDYISMISRDAYSERGRAFSFTRSQTLEGLELLFKINIALRMIHILESHCEEQCEIKEIRIS
jgi:hypothetical protein